MLSEPDIPALTEEDTEIKEYITEAKEEIDERNNEWNVLLTHRLKARPEVARGVYGTAVKTRREAAGARIRASVTSGMSNTIHSAMAPKTIAPLLHRDPKRTPGREHHLHSNLSTN